MWKSISLRYRILLMLSALVLITMGGGITSIWHTYMTDKLFSEVLDLEVPALQDTRELEYALVMQKGYVTYYFQDSDPEWLRELKKQHDQFEQSLKKARREIRSESEREIIDDMHAKYIRYSHLRDQVVDLYKAGKKEEGAKLQRGVREQFFGIIELCRRLNEAHQDRMERARTTNRKQARSVYQLALVALLVVVGLGAVLTYTLVKQVLGPIHQLAMGPDASRVAGVAEDEVKALSRRFAGLMKDIDQTKSKLEWSRQHLQQAEKWALLGKLAAGVAHSIRNPLTSVNMRLFSLERSLKLAPAQREDFEVISEGIRHIDSIVNNFLEFSRAPKLRLRLASPSDAVDMAIQLLRHRLESYNVTVEVKRNGRLPRVLADLEQLKEVLVNLIVNACEAMVHGGSVEIEEGRSASGGLGPVVTIKITDTGPGAPESIRDKIFQPFFSTKEEGTGLGLSIATRIVEEHGGWLDLQSEQGRGATFVITLPAKEEHVWEES